MNSNITRLALFFLSLAAFPSTALSAVLQWDINTEPGVAGYKIYYRTDSPNFPYNGTNLPQGNSPIYVDGASSSQLDLEIPDDGKIYYFSATTVGLSGEESAYSEIVSSPWIPVLLSPYEDSIQGTNLTFQWSSPPTGTNFTYDLYYGTDVNFNLLASSAPAVLTGNSYHLNGLDSFHPIPISIIITLIAAGLATRFGRMPIRKTIRLGIPMFIFSLLAACGGGSGSDGNSGSLPGTIVSDPAGLFTNVETNLSTTSININSLQPSTRYYWKVVAVDNWGNTYESLTGTFTTTSN